MSASAIASALVETLSSTSRFGPKSVGLDYGVMETTNASCVVVSWTGIEAVQDQFGYTVDSERGWTFMLDMFSKDTGNTKVALSRTLNCVDDLLGALKDDPTIQGTVQRIQAIRGSREIDRGYEVPGGGTWLRMPVELDVLEWPDG